MPTAMGATHSVVYIMCERQKERQGILANHTRGTTDGHRVNVANLLGSTHTPCKDTLCSNNFEADTTIICHEAVVVIKFRFVTDEHLHIYVVN